MHISKKAKNVTGSLTLLIDAQAKELRAKGESVIGFGAGEPDFDTPENIREAAKHAIDTGQTRYTPASGTMELKEAICEKFRKAGLKYMPEQIVVTNGAKQAIHNSLCAIINPGDEAIIPSPYWVSYPELVEMAGGIPVFVKADAKNDFNVIPEDIEKAITHKTKVIMINSPGNPCGNIYGKEELEKIADIAIKHDLIVISDEIYDRLVYDEKEAISIATLGEDIKNRTIVINGMSKTYAMTGWRIGYSASSVELAAAMGRWQSHATSNPNSVAQKAALEALTGPQQSVDAMKHEFEKRRNYMVQRINDIKGLSCPKPSGAFYILLNIEKIIDKNIDGQRIKNSETFCELLLQNAKVATVPGAGFGIKNYVRMSYATSMKDIEEGMDRIEQFVNSLQ